MGHPLSSLLYATSSIQLTKFVELLKSGHQEIQRILEELENIYLTSKTEWLNVDSIQGFLCTQLGYEDQEELEDALHMSFTEFLRCVPTVTLKEETHSAMHGLEKEDGGEQKVESSSFSSSSSSSITTTASNLQPLTTDPHFKETKNVYFRMMTFPLQGQEDQATSSVELTFCPTQYIYHVTQPHHVWNVLIKSPLASIEIPELDLEIHPDGRKTYETLWHLLSTLVLNLSTYVMDNTPSNSVSFSTEDQNQNQNQNQNEDQDEKSKKLMSMVSKIGNLQDLDMPWTVIVNDPSGYSMFADMSEVEVITQNQNQDQNQDQNEIK
ncbi:hypothetical protein HMI56_005185 [Coelomomyces lativittatus]|nr:hypothetical protein HMI56_005185 [Coelomomyces lativittatus]